MPASGNAPSIPVANANNVVAVLNAIRAWIIALTNTDGGRADLTGQTHPIVVAPFSPSNPSGAQSPTVQGAAGPSGFLVINQVINNYVYPTYGGSYGGVQTVVGYVIVPQLVSLTLKNPVTGETWTWTAPGSLTNGSIGMAPSQSTPNQSA